MRLAGDFDEKCERAFMECVRQLLAAGYPAVLFDNRGGDPAWGGSRVLELEFATQVRAALTKCATETAAG